MQIILSSHELKRHRQAVLRLRMKFNTAYIVAKQLPFKSMRRYVTLRFDMECNWFGTTYGH